MSSVVISENRKNNTKRSKTSHIANLYKYADSNEKTGYYLRGRSPSSGYFNLQTTPAANRLFEQMSYEAGRVPHTEGESVPGELTWRMYQTGLLETDNSDSPINNLSKHDLKETFDKSNEESSLSEADLDALQSFIKSYSGAGDEKVSKLSTLIESINESDSTRFDFATGTNHDEFIKARTDAAGTSLSEIKDRVKQLENSDERQCHPSAGDIASHPGGPESFTQLWDAPARIQAIYGTKVFDTLNYHLEYSTDTVENLEISIADHTIHTAPSGIESSLVGSFATQADAEPADCEYVIQFYDRYDPQHAGGDDEFTLYGGEKPIMTHTVHIDDGRIQRWTAEVTAHKWSRALRLLVFRKAGTYIGAVASFFDEFDGYHLNSPAHDFHKLTIDFIVKELNAEQKENLRNAIE